MGIDVFTGADVTRRELEDWRGLWEEFEVKVEEVGDVGEPGPGALDLRGLESPRGVDGVARERGDRQARVRALHRDG